MLRPGSGRESAAPPHGSDAGLVPRRATMSGCCGRSESRASGAGRPMIKTRASRPNARAGPDLEGRRALPDVPEAQSGALLPRRDARRRERPELHRLGRVAAAGELPAGRRPRRPRRDDRVVPDPLPVPAGQPDAVPARGAPADRDRSSGRSTCGSGACSTWRSPTGSSGSITCSKT